MPSFFSKLYGSSKYNNPYQNPHHSGHAPLPQDSNTQPQFNTQPTPPLRPVSPTNSSNLLAEARQVANRDPITGRPLPPTASKADAKAKAKAKTQSTEPSRANAELHTYLAASEEKKLRAEAERLVRSGQRLEFYAPVKTTE